MKKNGLLDIVSQSGIQERFQGTERKSNDSFFLCPFFM